MFDDLPTKKTDEFAPRNLEPLSIDELNSYITELKDEITRVETEIARKEAHKQAVSGIFKSNET